MSLFSSPSPSISIPSSMGGLDFLPSVCLSTTLTHTCTSLLLLPSHATLDAPPLVVCGKENGETLIFSSDFSQRFGKSDACTSPITALAYGRATNQTGSELVTISADGQLTLFKVIEGATLILQPTFHQLVQANITAAVIADVDRDGMMELVVIMTDRVLRTFQWCAESNRFLPRNKWEVPAHVASVAIGESATRQYEAWLSQAGSRQYVAIRFSGDHSVTICDSRMDAATIFMPYRADFVRTFGSLVTGIVVHVNQKERRLRMIGGDIIGLGIVRLPSKVVVVTVDVNGLCLLYAYNERIIRKMDIDPIMRMTVLKDTFHMALIGTPAAVYVTVATSRGRLANYEVPMRIIDHRFAKASS
ncbi:hypothetical protein PMAYCL1PPCAC_02020 [Pristionchus mayeri]|uniref:Uncharacterized protein n=1 Tax=Pristionchus mayeri TaxID=1317129 RepID=A0AAN4Z5X2_9BILA|nr:hypothetical protein PMAYCL1PPCAC_02020 [Pristionchus mayeri]